MSKNILIFSDGTGQAGGIKPDQRLSNIYKLFRATRIGPDSPIDPAQQIAFYDAGLGTESDAGGIPLRTVQFIRKFASSATGGGISRNIVDCYEAILEHYEPGDRVFLFGFSRGAYTVRCVAGVLNLCGIPTYGENGSYFPKYGRALRAIAEEAVGKVYEHGAGRDRGNYEAEREEQARRFRKKYGSDDNGRANVAPYFIGVFDTVASLGASGIRRLGMLTALLLGAAVVSSVFAALATLIGVSFIYAFVTILCVGGVILAVKLFRSSFKIIRNFPENHQTQWHFSGWQSGFYDRYLDKRVRFARHALAIDETRKDFARVEWGKRGEDPDRSTGEPEWFQQIWFAGNHSDIGGSYPEDESRLSDIALQWMVEEATSVPHPILVDETKLHLFPSADGMQHCEVEDLRDKYPWWVPRRWRRSWKEAPRKEVPGAPLHPTVIARFRLNGVLHYGHFRPYRPETLRNDPRVIDFYSGSS